MFRNIRAIHKWIGLVNSLFLVVISCTGLLLALKKRFDWIQPPTHKGEVLANLNEVVPIGKAADAVFAANVPELKSMEDVNRFELHVDKNVFKVTSKEGFKEVQVDAKTGEVLSVAQRNDMMFEAIHDMSFIHESLHTWVLPLVAISLFLLGVSGAYMFSVPVFRRWKYRQKQGVA
ncbi:MAG TPA: PepSY-associated TM helix domain-containing protein [Fimbriimonadaceae bacterium]|nr:PepSY-associated TM helix domain-containing protein [Fimbriimonadaceae bacterium]